MLIRDGNEARTRLGSLKKPSEGRRPLGGQNACFMVDLAAQALERFTRAVFRTEAALIEARIAELGLDLINAQPRSVSLASAFKA